MDDNLLDLNQSVFSTDPVKRVAELESFLAILMHRVIRLQDENDQLKEQILKRA